MTGLLRSHLLQLATVPPVASESFQWQYHRERVAFNEQLPPHFQTIEALEAEKAELQSALSQSEQAVRQMQVETEELRGRLRAFR